jgi:uncharacterized protein (DUF1697 family)
MNYVVLLRGINVGGRIIRMADLKACLEKAGLQNVKTVLQSGNILLDSGQGEPDLKIVIEKSLSKTFNYPAKVQVLSLANLRKIVDDYPFDTAGSAQHDYVIFMEDGLEKNLVKEEYILAAGEKVRAGQGVVYWRVDKGSTLKSGFAKWLTKSKYKAFNTNRNLRTLSKILSG